MFAEHQPVRTCVGCRVRAQAGELLRVVAVPPSSHVPAKSGEQCVEVDGRRRKPGRGAWVHPTPECVALAEKRRAFGRALRLPGLVDVTAVHHHVNHLTAPSVAAVAAGGRPDVSRK